MSEPCEGQLEVSDKIEIDPELECPICIKLLYKPISTTCGHTFCELCLEAALEHRPLCPLCREPVSRSDSCHENRLVQSIIARQYPAATHQRETEVRTAVVIDDQLARARRREEVVTFLSRNRPLTRSLAEGTASVGDEEEPGFMPVEVPLIFQHYKYELPFPKDYVELYLEAPMLLDMVADVMANEFPGFVILLEIRGATQSPKSDTSPPSSPINQSEGSDVTPTDRSSDVESADGSSSIVGVMVDLKQCLTFHDQLEHGNESPHQSRGALRALFSSVRFPSGSRRGGGVAAWVPRRLYQHRMRIQGNRRDMWQQPPTTTLFPEGCCIVRGECVFRITVDRDSFRCGPKGYTLGVVKPLFDAPLDFELPHLTLRNRRPLSPYKTAEYLTRSLSAKISTQLASTHLAGKVLFQRKFGNLPPLLPRPTSLHLEFWSLWACRVLQISAMRKARLMQLTDTVVRLQQINKLTSRRKQISLNLTSVDSTESLSWMLATGPGSGCLLGLVMILLLVATALWHRANWGGRGLATIGADFYIPSHF